MFVSRLMIAGALALAVAGGAVAQNTFGARWLARQQAFAASLDLTAAQQASLSQLRARELAFRGDARADVAQLATRVKADLADPHADLHATVHTIQSDVDRLLAAHRDVTAAKLAFYDSLDARQQAKVRAQLLARIEKLERLRDALVDFAEVAQ